MLMRGGGGIVLKVIDMTLQNFWGEKMLHTHLRKTIVCENGALKRAKNDLYKSRTKPLYSTPNVSIRYYTFSLGGSEILGKIFIFWRE